MVSSYDYAQNVAVIAGAILTVLLLTEAMRRVVAKPLLATLKKTRAFLDEWAGEPARNGFVERPGVMQRLAQMDVQLEDLNATTKGTEWHVGNGDKTRLRTVVENDGQRAKLAEERSLEAIEHVADLAEQANDTHIIATANAEAIAKFIEDMIPELKLDQRRQAEINDETSEDRL